MTDGPAMPHGPTTPYDGAISDALESHQPVLLTPIDYPFIATVEGEFIALRAIVRLHQREGTWSAILLDGERHEIEASTARTILDQGPFDRAYVPSTMFEPHLSTAAMAHDRSHSPVHGQPRGADR